MTSVATEPLVSLETAARFTRDTALATWAVVPRTAGVTSSARSIAALFGLDVDVVIEAATIGVRFVLRHPAVADRPQRHWLRKIWAG